MESMHHPDDEVDRAGLNDRCKPSRPSSSASLCLDPTQMTSMQAIKPTASAPSPLPVPLPLL
jgi:hypothetical protein